MIKQLKPKAGKGTDRIDKDFLNRCSQESVDELWVIVTKVIKEKT